MSDVTRVLIGTCDLVLVSQVWIPMIALRLLRGRERSLSTSLSTYRAFATDWCVGCGRCGSVDGGYFLMV
eukprot:1188431-Prorocentrum_minimum.AAC.1